MGAVQPMNPARWQQVSEIVADAVEYSAGNERSQYLDRACAGDPELRREVESLLAQSSDAFDACVDQIASADAAAKNGTRVGLYRIVREIGRGGMGAVYLAERADEEFEKQVAIKILKRGTDTEEVLRRFRTERQILARLEHPNIARLIDAGTTRDGLPYFGMEYVEGQRIADFCEQRKLNVRERIELFLKVCDAVQFAHRNLIVHRDIKPGNILVTAEGEPKLLDFGIAKLIAAADETIQLTIPAEQRLTPGYASPEQVRNEQVTTAADVYSLGALLFELLSGQPPHRFATATPSSTELMRVIVQEERPRASALAAPERKRELRGDLDNILATALRKEPEHRYSGVTAFADDLRRHLDRRPVRARPATIGYRASRFIRRNKLGVAAAGILLLTLLGGIIATTWQWRVARAERARAERRFNDVRRLANSFMFELHDEIDKGPVKAKELLVRRASEYLNSLAEEAAGDRDLQRELAIAYIKIGDVQGRFLLQNLGDTKGAFESYSKALQLSEQLAAGKPGDRELQEWLALSRLRVGEINMSLGNSTEAARQFRHGLAIVESLLNANPSDAALRVNAANAHRLVGMALGLPGVTNLGDTVGALEQLRRAAALFESLSPEELAKSRPIFSLNTADNRMEFAAVYAELAELLRASGAPGEAIEFQRKALVLCDAVLVDHPKNVQVRRNTAAHTWNVAAQLVTTGGNLDEALGLIRKSLAIYEQLAAEDPNDVNARKDLAQSHRNMARVLSARKEPAGAIEHNSKAVALFREIVARDATNAFMRRQLALTEMRQSMFLSDDARPQEAMPHAREAVSIGEDLIAADAKNATARDTLARSYSQLGRCHVQLASLTTAADQKRAGLREAISCYQRSRDAWLTLRDSGALPAVDAGKIGDVERETARCEEELRGL